MKQVDGNDDAHVVLLTLGDISIEPPSIEAIKQANMSALAECDHPIRWTADRVW